MIPDEIIAEVLDRTDIVSLVGRYVELRKAGTLFKGLCPFHQEKTPSFTVSPVRRTYKCFGCGEGGNAVGFLIAHDNLSFPEALRELAAACGVEVPDRQPRSPAQEARRKAQKTQEERLLQVQDQLATFYARALAGPEGGRARGYLRQRGVSPRAAEAFRLGWASGNKAAFDQWMKEKGVHPDDLELLGLLMRPEEGLTAGAPLDGRWLRFRDRLMFPVVNLRGGVVGFGGRVLDGNRKAAKYINSPETPVYTKGEQLYGAHTARHAARQAGRLVLCEGNVDVIALWQAGFEGTVAAMGTALTPKQVRLVKRLSEQVICVMDGDAAGEKAAFASLLPFLEAGLQPRAVMLPPGEDPDSFVRAHGPDAFGALLDGAAPLLDLQIEHLAAEHPDDPPGRAAALRALAPALTLLSDEVTRGLYLKAVARRLAVDVEDVEMAVRGATPPETSRATSPSMSPPPPPPEPEWLPPGFLEEPPGPPPEANSWAAEALSPARFEVVKRGPVFGSGFERQVVECILQYPTLAVRFCDGGGTESLTDAGLAGFVACFCEEVRAGRTPNEDRLLNELDDAELATALMGLLARHSNRTEEDVSAAFEVAFREQNRAHLVRRRSELIRRMSQEKADPGALERSRAELGIVQQEINRLGVEGAH